MEALTPRQAQEMLFKICGLIPMLSVRINQASGTPSSPQEELITVKQAVYTFFKIQYNFFPFEPYKLRLFGVLHFVANHFNH